MLCAGLLAGVDMTSTTLAAEAKPKKAASAETKPAAPKTQADAKDKDKPKEEKKEEEKPSPPPSGPQTDGKFRKVILASDQKVGDVYEDTLADPMELAVAKDGRVFFIERGGKVKLWKPQTQTTSVIGEIKVFTDLEDGLIGLALDPNFQENHWLYLHYSLPDTGTNAAGMKVGTNRVSRFTVRGDALDMASEKPVLDIPTQREKCCHVGGSLAFDAQGNLYISVGDNTNPFESDGFSPIDQRKGRSPFDAQVSSANSNDLRGKVLRIRPLPDGGYTVPEGNLFPQAASGKMNRQSVRIEKGAQGLMTPPPLVRGATRPEIYVMGCRNPFRISVDPRSGFLYWGDVGPDAKEFKESRGPAGMDEINQARQAGNFGWPYFIGENKPYWIRDFKASTNAVFKARFDPSKPVNKSPNNSGLKKLPPAQPAFIYYPASPSVKFPAVNGEGGRTAMAGPVYYFDPELKSSRKLPKDFDHTLFIYEWSRNWIIAVHLDKDEKIAKMERFCPKMTFKRPMDMELGPDGCLYVIEWGTGWKKNKDTQIVRVEYAGD